jgi:hypothetical protein
MAPQQPDDLVEQLGYLRLLAFSNSLRVCWSSNTLRNSSRFGSYLFAVVTNSESAALPGAAFSYRGHDYTIADRASSSARLEKVRAASQASTSARR